MDGRNILHIVVLWAASVGVAEVVTDEADVCDGSARKEILVLW